MLSKEAFTKGIKDMRAVFGLNPDKETLEIWYRHLAKLDDKYFLAGVSLLAENEEAFYPNTNIIFKIKKYSKKAKEKELEMVEQTKEPWEIERYRAIRIETQKTRETSIQRLLDRRPELRELIEKTGLCIFDKRRLL